MKNGEGFRMAEFCFSLRFMNTIGLCRLRLFSVMYGKNSLKSSGLIVTLASES